MKVTFASLASGCVLFAVAVVPSLARAFGATSMAAGAFLVAVLFVFLFAALCALHRLRQSLGNLALYATLTLAVVFFNGAFSFSIHPTFNVDRFLQTYAFLIIYLSGALSLALLAQSLSRRDSDIAVRFSFYALLLTGVAAILGFRPFFPRSISVVFFSENSHYALSFLPLLLYMTVRSSTKRKWIFPFIGLSMALLLQNLTLLVGAIGIAIIAMRFRLSVILGLIAMPILLVAINFNDLSYYSSRVDLSRENTNLSALAYMDGWQRAYLNLKDYFGLGVGFEQLGFVGTEGDVVNQLAAQNAEELNLFDGSCVAAKLISEFGILALGALVVYLRYLAKHVGWLREVSMNGGKAADPRRVFFLGCFTMFFIDFFLRGTGYFSSSGFLFIASLAWITLDHPGKYKLQE